MRNNYLNIELQESKIKMMEIPKLGAVDQSYV